MKLLLLTTSFPLTKDSGSGIFIKKLVDHLPSDIRVTVLTPDSSCKVHSDYPFSLVCFRYGPKKWQQLAHGSGGLVTALFQKKCFFLLLPIFLGSFLVESCWRARSADVLHANWSISGAIAGIAGFLTGKPVITTLRGSDVNLIHSSWLLRQLVRGCLLLGQCIVTVSPSLKKIIVSEFPRYRNKIKIISNGIDESFFASRVEPQEQAGHVRFLHVGNLTINKGVKIILEVASSLLNEDWSVDIVGDGPEREWLEEYCQDNGLNSKVFFHGAVAPGDIPIFMQKADVLVFASASEGRPNVVLEAMATGLPIIASSIPAVQELVENGREGMLFPVGDVKRLREIMEYMISHPTERRMMGQKAREYIVAQDLSWQNAGKQYAALYTDAQKSVLGK